MKAEYIRILSDTHLEAFTGIAYSKLAEKFIPEDPRDEASILILAGDISSKPEQLVGFIKEVEHRFVKIICVSGNHEFYRNDYHEHATNLENLISTNLVNTLHSLNSVECLISDDLRIIYGTLWADGGKNQAEYYLVNNALNDFRLIKYEDRIFNVLDMIFIHKEQKAKLKAFLELPFSGKTVVVSHHLPSYSLCHPRFGNQINGGFASNCDNLISDYEPELWVFGHTHDRISRVLGHTRMECNPVGYKGEWNTQFSGGSPLFLQIGHDF